MLPKNRRISKKEFPYILSKGKRYASPNLFLYMAINNTKNGNLSRFAFSLSKKISKTAVERNKYRRRGYSAIGRNIDRVKDGYFLFFTFKTNPNTIRDLEEEILGLLSLGGVLS